MPLDAMLFAASSLDVIEAAEGKPPRIDILAYDGGVMNVPGFGPVVVDLAGMEIAKTISFLRDHENTVDSLVGQGEARIEAGKLHASGFITDDTAAGQSVIKLSKPTNGRPAVKFQASIGAAVHAKREIRAGETVSVNGRRITASGAGFTLVSKSLLREVTVCVLGCDPGTSVSIAAKEGKMSQDTAFDAWLAEKTFDPATTSEAQKSVLKAAFDAEIKAKTTQNMPVSGPQTTPEADPVAELRAKAGAEALRIADVTEATKDHPDIRAKAIAGGWSKVEAELAVLRDERAKAPAAHINASSAKLDGLVIEAALAQAGRLEDHEKKFDDKTLQAAHTKFGGRIGLQELLMQAAWDGGYLERSVNQAVRGDLRGMLKAAFSTLSLPGILSNNANKYLLEGFMTVENVWSLIAARGNLNDFKTTTRYRPTGDFQFELLGPTSEIKHGQVGEDSMTISLDTYAKMFSVTRRDIINDDLGAITTVPRRLGRGAGLAVNNVFWTKFLNNSTFFTSGRNNYFTGAATNLQSSSLATALQKFRDQTDQDGKPMAISPRILLVPTALEVTALELMQSTNYNTGGAATDTRVPNKNIWAGMFTPAVSAYLGNSSYTGYSATAWYLLADPQDVPVIEVAFLNGVEQPTIESADADFDQLGIQMRGYLDFGVEFQEYRGGVKSKGAS